MTEGSVRLNPHLSSGASVDPFLLCSSSYEIEILEYGPVAPYVLSIALFCGARCSVERSAKSNEEIGF